MIPTDEQVAAEILALKTLKPKINRRNFFGDDLHEQIDAQIKVLEDRMSTNDAYNRWETTGDDDVDADEGRSDDVCDSAIVAANWLEGRDSGGDTPSKDWQELADRKA